MALQIIFRYAANALMKRFHHFTTSEHIIGADNFYLFNYRRSAPSKDPIYVGTVFAEKSRLTGEWTVYKAEANLKVPRWHTSISDKGFYYDLKEGVALDTKLSGVAKIEKIYQGFSKQEVFNLVSTHEITPPVRSIRDGLFETLTPPMPVVQVKPEKNPAYWRNLAI